MKDSKIILKKDDCIAMIKSNDWCSLGKNEMGWGNGYVAIPKTHVLYGKDYIQIHEEFEIDVHFELTYSEKSMIFDDMWVLGFDTMHLGDNIFIWPEEAVKQETLKLMRQLINLYKED